MPFEGREKGKTNSKGDKEEGGWGSKWPSEENNQLDLLHKVGTGQLFADETA